VRAAPSSTFHLHGAFGPTAARDATSDLLSIVVRAPASARNSCNDWRCADRVVDGFVRGDRARLLAVCYPGIFSEGGAQRPG